MLAAAGASGATTLAAVRPGGRALPPPAGRPEDLRRQEAQEAQEAQELQVPPELQVRSSARAQ